MSVTQQHFHFRRSCFPIARVFLDVLESVLVVTVFSACALVDWRQHGWSVPYVQDLLDGFLSTWIIFQRNVSAVWESLWLLFPWKCSVPSRGWNPERTREVGETLNCAINQETLCEIMYFLITLLRYILSKRATQVEEMSDKQTLTCVVLLPSDISQRLISLTHPSFFISACLAVHAFIFYIKGRVCSQNIWVMPLKIN